MTQSIAAIALLAADYEAACDFYSRIMGFEIAENAEAGSKHWVLISPSGGRGASLILTRVDQKRQIETVVETFDQQTFLTFETDNFDREHARMLAAGVTFETEPRQDPMGKSAVWLDPIGTRWNLIQRA